MTEAIHPVPDELTRPFWAAAAEHRLALQRCDSCERINHPPQWLCAWCGSAELTFREVTCGWRVASWTSAPRRAKDSSPPAYHNVVAEADEQPGVLLVGRVAGERPGWLRIGAPVQVCFQTLSGSDVVLPDFEPVPENVDD